jgi:hypothetical protein
MQHPELYSIQEARKVLGDISRNAIYQLLRSGEFASVVVAAAGSFSRRGDHRADRPVDDHRQVRTRLNTIAQEAPRWPPPSLATGPSQSRATGTQFRS